MIRVLIVFAALVTIVMSTTYLDSLAATAQSTDPDTGLAIDSGWEVVKSTCTRCHSADIVRQNSGSRDVWQSRIVWMQETQGLELLDAPTETTILDYLTKNYPQRQATRRPPMPALLMPANPYD